MHDDALKGGNATHASGSGAGDVDWTKARATLNLGTGVFTWVREVSEWQAEWLQVLN